MMYPYAPASPLLVQWQKEFISACEERVWPVAARLIASHIDEAPDVIGRGEFPGAVTVFITQAPESAVRVSRLPRQDLRIDRWRPMMIERIIEANLTRARYEFMRGNWAAAQMHLATAIDMRARSVAHETMIAAVMTDIGIAVGDAESIHASSRPDLEADPSAVAPHLNDIRGTNKGYHPSFFADLAARAVAGGGSEAFRELIIRMIIVHLHWPSWRALAGTPAREQYILRKSADVVLRANLEMQQGARAHLRAFVAGATFRSALPSKDPDDVEF